MKAVGYDQAGPIGRPGSLQDIELDDPHPVGRDLLVRIRAVSVNPVDAKVRAKRDPEGSQWKVLGYDAAGVVEAVGDQVRCFQPGDAVYYAGSIARPGTNSELHLVDERIVGKKPESIGFAEAAALPLTTITAWEMLFDRLDVRRPTAQGGGAILIVGGAGGVGSITIQLLRALTDLSVIATASRPETEEWVKACGAHHVINHATALAPQIVARDLTAPGFVFSTTQTDRHFLDIIELIAPQGRFGLIDDPPTLDLMAFKLKALSIHWELMFTRPLFDTPDIEAQGRLLNEVSSLVDQGRIRSTMTQVAGPINAETLRSAHALIESGRARGKIVLEGF